MVPKMDRQRAPMKALTMAAVMVTLLVEATVVLMAAVMAYAMADQ